MIAKQGHRGSLIQVIDVDDYINSVFESVITDLFLEEQAFQ